MLKSDFLDSLYFSFHFFLSLFENTQMFLPSRCHTWLYEKRKGQKTGHALLFSIKRLVITMTPATPTATATVPQPTATTMSIISEDRLDRFVFPV